MNPTCVLALCALFAFASCGAPPAAPAATPSAPAARSITVFPVSLAGRPSAEAANVVGILLERGGAETVELDEQPFPVAAGANAADEATAFGSWVASRGLATDLALRVAIDGSPQSGIAAVRTMLVDKQGKAVVDASHAKGTPEFDAAAPKEPMDCCVFAVNSLRDVLGLQDPMRGNANTSKLQARMQQRAGVPDEKEAEAMMQRLSALRALGKEARIRVFPARVGDAWSQEAAAQIAARLEASGLCAAAAEQEPLAFTTRRSANQQAVLWSGARSMQEALRAREATPSYSLVCDFLQSGASSFGAVHTCLFAPDGSFVWIDLQNSHHDDFASISPSTANDCAELSSIRLLGALRGD